MIYLNYSNLDEETQAKLLENSKEKIYKIIHMCLTSEAI